MFVSICPTEPAFTKPTVHGGRGKKTASQPIMSSRTCVAAIRICNGNCRLNSLPIKTPTKIRFGKDFDPLRQETFEWMKGEDLAMFFFNAGKEGMGYHAVAVVPANCGFFAMGWLCCREFWILLISHPISKIQRLSSTPHLLSVIPTLTASRWWFITASPATIEMFSYNLYPGSQCQKRGIRYAHRPGRRKKSG